MKTVYAINPLLEETALSQNDRLSEYTAQLKQVQAQLPGVQSRRQWAGLGILLCLVPGIACGWLTVAGGPLWPIALLIVLLCAGQVIRLYRHAGEKWKQFAAQEESLERGIARLSNSWQSEETGLEFARPDHLYQEDLQVLGSGSLFTLLATTRSRIGAERLAVYLLDPVDANEVRLRQESVKELAQTTGIREQMQLLGSYQEQDCTASDFATWLDSPLLRTPIVIPCILLGTSAISLALVIGIWAGALAWYPVVLPAAASLLVQTCVVALHFKRIRSYFRQLRQMTRSLTVLRQGLRLMETLEFRSPKLRHIIERLRKDHAATNVRTLERLVRALDQREKLEFYLISRLCAAGMQLVFATDRWRTKHQYEFREWLDIWAEFEALQALALYAFEHPQCIFPKLVEGGCHPGSKTVAAPAFTGCDLRRQRCAIEPCHTVLSRDRLKYGREEYFAASCWTQRSASPGWSTGVCQVPAFHKHASMRGIFTPRVSCGRPFTFFSRGGQTARRSSEARQYNTHAFPHR